MPESYQDRMQEYKDRINEDYHSVFDELVGHGSNPKTVGAAIQYVTTTATQEEASREWECSKMGVRQNYPAVLAMLDRDGVEESVDRETAETVVQEIAEELDWSEGVEYSIGEVYGSAVVNVNKPGLVSIRDALVGGSDE